MPISSRGFARASLAFIVVGVLALIGVVGTAIWLVERTQAYFDEVVEAREARGAAVELRNLLLDAETGQRGYLLTLDETYLDRYGVALANIEGAYNRLARVLQAYPQADEPVAALRIDLDAKLDEMARTVEMARDGRVSEAIAIVRTDTGEVVMGRVRQLLDGVIEAADLRTFSGVIDQRGAAQALRIVALLGALVIVAVVGGAAWVVLRYTRELDFARNEVEILNRDLEARVAERTLDLRRANEEVQRFAYIVTHDLRAPLVNIMGFTSELDTTMKSIQAYVLADGEALDAQEIQEARTAASEDLPEAIGFIRSSTRKMDSLINAILKISRDGRRPLKPERIDLRELLEANLATIQHQVVDSDGETILDVDAPAIISDRMALEQAVGNLLDNAVKYRAPDRPIEIRVEARRAPGNRICIDVADNGRGIAPEDHERVFDLFRRSGQQDQPGEGIGLAHVRTLVRGLGGDITIESEFGKGSTFTIYLPVDVRTATRSFEA